MTAVTGVIQRGLSRFSAPHGVSDGGRRAARRAVRQALVIIGQQNAAVVHHEPVARDVGITSRAAASRSGGIPPSVFGA